MMEKGSTILFSAALNAHCGGARKSEAIFDALAAEVNDK